MDIFSKKTLQNLSWYLVDGMENEWIITLNNNECIRKSGNREWLMVWIVGIYY